MPIVPPSEEDLLADLAPAMTERGFALRGGYAQFRKVVDGTIVATIQPRYIADSIVFRPIVALTETRHERHRTLLLATTDKAIDADGRPRWDRPTVAAWHPQSMGSAELRDPYGRTHPFWMRALGWPVVRRNLLRWVDDSALPWVRRHGNRGSIVDLLARAAAAQKERGVADADDLLIGLYLDGQIVAARNVAREYARYAVDPSGSTVPALDDADPEAGTSPVPGPNAATKRMPRRPGHLIDFNLLLVRLARRFDPGLIDAL